MSAANVSKIEKHGHENYSAKCLLCKQVFSDYSENYVLTVVNMHFEEQHGDIVPIYSTFEAKE